MVPAADNQKLTPAMRQYRHFKDQYPQAVLFFRMGDFYETFYEDAEICSRVLGIALTSRSKAENPIPLAGIPYHALDTYLHKMIKAGHKVAICEQVEDAAQAKGVVKRDVVRLVTPGTLTEDSLLEENVGNYLAAVCFDRSFGSRAGKTSHSGKPVAPGSKPEYAGLAWVDLSTGQFFAQLLESRFLLDEIIRLAPSECLLSDDTEALPEKFISQLKELSSAGLTTRPGWLYDSHQAVETLKKHFGTASLEGFGFSRFDCSLAAAAAVIDYLNETQKTAIGHIAGLRRVSRDKFLHIDKATIRSLEVERTIRDNATAGSLLHCLDETNTAMGARKLRLWLCYPLNNLENIQTRQDSVAELFQLDRLREDLRKHLSQISDIERIATRISTGRASPRDLLHLARTLRQLPGIKLLLEECSSAMVSRLTARCDLLKNIADLIESAINPDAPLTFRNGGIIRDGYNEEIDRLRSIGRDGKSWLAQYQKRLVEQAGFSNLKIGFNKVFGYYVEVSHAFKGQIPPDFVRKQTIKNAERYITDELKRYETDALNAEQRCGELEDKLFQDVRTQTAAQTLRLQQVADVLAKIDCLCCLAHIARHRNYCRPNLHLEPEIQIVEGRHPVLDVSLADRFVPNDLTLTAGSEADKQIAIITGPNMSGKSTYIRQTALLVLMAQMGGFIPAKSASFGLVDRIFTRIGASDELTRGQSTFMVEMIETANILNNATDRSLVILDEVGRGTSTYDGLALAWAITEHIATTIKCRTLFATHYHEITELADLLANVINLNVAVREWKDDVVFLHKIIPGRTDKSYGIHVARLAGIPKNVLSRSREILDELESSFSREAHVPQLGGRLEAPDGQKLLFDNAPPDPLLEKLRHTDLNNLTPIQAINMLHEIIAELENR